MNFKYYRAKPYIPDSDKEWILEKYKEILDTGGLIQGKYVSQFEDSVATYVGTKHAIAVNPVDKPSNPSVRFIAFEVAIIMIIIKGI